MPLNSKTPDKVIADVKSAVSAGFHNIILLAENSTEYGIDLAVNVRLLDLLKSIVLIDEVTSLNVCGLCMDELALNPELVSFLRDCEKIHLLRQELQAQGRVEQLAELEDALSAFTPEGMASNELSTEEAVRTIHDLLNKL